jgi:hypothetical protein
MKSFRILWSSVLGFITELSDSGVSLVYFSGLMMDEGLLSIFPYLSIESKHKGRFFIPRLCKDVQSNSPITGRVCLEYHCNDFAELAAPSGFKFFPGTEIMGITVNEALVKDAIRKDVFNKDTLEQLLPKVDCWWVCDSDLEGMAILHKFYSGNELAQKLQEEVLRKFGYPIKVYRD